ncbi:alcohol dehydrogenase, partial [Bacteroidota bacterium]
LWKHEQTNQYSVHANTPVYNNGYILCFSGYGRGGVMLKLSDDGGSVSKVWFSEALDSRMGGMVYNDGRVYGSGDKNKRWMCADWKTGEELYSSDWIKVGNIIYADGKQYWYGQDGMVALVKAGKTEFETISKFKIPYGSNQHWAHLVINNKRLYVRHGNSLMVYSI